MNFVTAFPHDHGPDMMARKIATPAKPRIYLDMLKWIFLRHVDRQSGDSLSRGTHGGKDATPIDIAGRIAELTGGFAPPRLAA